MKGTVFRPRVLQLNLDNINRLPHSKHPDRKNRGTRRCENQTHDPPRARQTSKPPDHPPPPGHTRVKTDVLMDNVEWSWVTLQTPQYT